MDLGGACDGCRWAATVDDREGLVCVRFPPSYGAQRAGRLVSGFPTIRPDWTCGEFAGRATVGAGS